MKTAAIITVTLTAVLFGTTSCSKQKTQEAFPVPEENEITFAIDKSSFEAFVETKAEGGTVSVNGGINSLNDLVGGDVYWNCFNSGSKTLIYGNENIKAGINTTTGVVSTNKYWPSAQTNVIHFISNHAMGTGTAYNVVNVTSNDTDIVCGSLSASWKTAGSVSLAHIFARTGTVTVTAQEGYTISNVSSRLVAPSESEDYGSSGTYSIGTGWTSKNHTWTEADYGNHYVCPGKWAVKVTYTLTKGDYSETFTKTSGNLELVAGKVNNITATAIGGSASSIEFTLSLAPWQEHNVNAYLN